jgi:formamidopyrimidine-DNA glycosylase
MTGQLIYRHKGGKVGAEPNKFTHAIFDFKDGSKLFFNDIRKFGYLILTDEKGLKEKEAEYGIEPLGREYTEKKFQELLKRKPSWKIKQFLMDQTLLAGIGNIYADEALFFSGVSPLRRVKDISAREIKKLFKAIPVILKKSLAKGGTSADNYVDAYGRPGGFVPYLQVYGREGKKCKKCPGKIVRIRIGGRSAHYCPQCQK